MSKSFAWFGLVTRRRESRGKQRPLRHGFETLESRRVLDARVLITELVASNDEGLQDENGDRPDWIEIFNAGDASADLTGWHLTDDARNMTKWTFPATTLHPQQYLVVFASGKDRTEPAATLHTSFQLAAEGEFLALVQPDGTIASQFAPQYSALHTDVAWGLPQGETATVLVAASDSVRVLVPRPENGGNTLETAWTAVEFDDSAWRTGPGGVGFDAGSTFDEAIGTDVKDLMEGINATAFIRIPFVVDNARPIFSLKLRMKYDDGFVAYLNGVEVARANAPSPLLWDSTATASHRNQLALEYVDFDLSESVSLLQAGPNVLAIHGLNQRHTSNDFLMAAELHGGLPGVLEDHVARYVASPTPGQPNGTVTYGGLVAPIQVTATRGFYDAPLDVQLTTSTPGATLVYTTDGSVPSLENGTILVPADPFSAPAATVHIAQTTTLRAAAFKPDFLPSKINTQTYLMLDSILAQDFQATVDAGFPETWRRTPADYGLDPKVIGPDDRFDGEFARQIRQALLAAPSVSIVMDQEDLFGNQGIYTNSIRSGFDWERPASVEWIFPDTGDNVQASAGIRIQGDNVRDFSNSKKQSFRLEFRGRYGQTKLRYPLFGASAADTFDTIILRGQYNDGWVHTPTSTQYIRDQWARTTLLEMGQPNAHGRFMHVYLNGFYWGLYNVVERPNASFSSSYFGGDKDEWDALNTGRVRDGDGNAWAQLRRLVRDVDVDDPAASNAAYLRLLGKHPDGTDNPQWETLLDVENYIDYLIVNFYGGNVDWPHRNWYAGRRQGNESTGFKFYAWDTEKILDHGEGSTLQTNRTNQLEGVADPYRFLRGNEEFRLQFADRVHRHFFHGGALYVDPDRPQWDPQNPEHNVPAARYWELSQQVELPLIGESARWGDTRSSSTRNDERVYTLHDWRAKRDDLLENYFPRRSEIVLQQLVDAGLYPPLAAPAFHQHGGSIPAGFQLQMNAPGVIYYTLDGSDPRQSPLQPGVSQAGIAPTAIRYNGPVPLDRSTIVRARTYVDGQWSALNEATFVRGVPPLRVSELMYHPRLGNEPGRFEDEDFEFIELANVSSTQTIDLTGIELTAGIAFQFSGGQLLPGQRIVIARNEAAFQQRYGNDVPLAGQYGGTVEDFRLNNGGEQIRLEDGLGNVIQEFTYDDAWFPSTDGEGYSLTAIHLAAELDAWNAPSHWRASLLPDGSPGIHDQVDWNGDGQANAEDIDRFCTAQQANEQSFDLTGDGRVDLADLEFLVTGVLRTSLGDANLDGTFDTQDLVTIFQAGEYEDTVNGNSRWAEGDWNCDGDFTSGDLIAAFRRGAFVGQATPSLPANLPPHAAHRSLASALASDDPLFRSRAPSARRPAEADGKDLQPNTLNRHPLPLEQQGRPLRIASAAVDQVFSSLQRKSFHLDGPRQAALDRPLSEPLDSIEPDEIL